MPNKLSAYSSRGQGVFLILHALMDLGGTNTKADVISRISSPKWYDVTHLDLPPYEGRSEPKYHTLLAWARKDCYDREWMLKTDLQNDWAISLDGRRVLERTVLRFRTKELDVRKCYLWSAHFKKMIDPDYVASPADTIRPDILLEQALDLL